MSLKIVFMGTPKFSVPTLNALIKNKFNILNVYTQPPKRSKRGQKVNPSPIEEFCKKNNINLNNPTKLNNKEELEYSIRSLLKDSGMRERLGVRAKEAIEKGKGATPRTVDLLKKL